DKHNQHQKTVQPLFIIEQLQACTNDFPLCVECSLENFIRNNLVRRFGKCSLKSVTPCQSNLCTDMHYSDACLYRTLEISIVRSRPSIKRHKDPRSTFDVEDSLNIETFLYP